MVHPEDIWDKQHGDLCEQFIATAKSYNFRHAYEFTTSDDKAIRAYGVGRCLIDGYERSLWSTFLCEDNVLRLSGLGLGSASDPPYGYKEGKICEISYPEISHVAPGYFSHRTRSITVGYDWEWGTFLGERMHESQVNPWMREWFMPERTPITTRVIDGVTFHEEPLEDVIEVHEAALALGNTPFIEGASGTVSNTRLFEALYDR